VPRYSPAFLLPSAAAIGGLAEFISRKLLLGLAFLTVVLSVAFTLPTMITLHSQPLPVMAAVRAAAQESGGGEELFHSQGLLPFIRFQQRTVGIRGIVKDERELLLNSEIPHMRFRYLGGAPARRVIRGPGSQVQHFSGWPPRADRLALQRFRQAVLVDGGVILGKGFTGVVSRDSRAASSRMQSQGVLFVQPGSKTLGLSFEVPGPRGPDRTIRLIQDSISRLYSLSAEIEVIRVTLQPQQTKIELELNGKNGLQKDEELFLLSIWCENQNFNAPPFQATPGDTKEAALKGVGFEGFFTPELFTRQRIPGAWSGAHARVVFPARGGTLSVTLLAPSSRPRRIRLSSDGTTVDVVVSTSEKTVTLPIAAPEGTGILEILSDVVVPIEINPKAHDRRSLGVVVLGLDYKPDPNVKKGYS